MPQSELQQQESAQADQSSRILVLFAHPSLERSEVNRPLAELTRGLPGVTLVDLYAEYPTLDINIDREQQRLLEHDVIVFMHPFYWYSTPAILKEWQDLVLEHGFAYGHEGTELHGKVFFNAITVGAPQSAYSEQGFNHFSLRELLCPLEQMANLCGMLFLPPFVLFSARTAVQQNRLPHHLADWQKLLRALHENRLDIIAAMRLDHLNLCVDTLALERAP
jgi:glutathione-regulated potassium-efflux system ancillary protein KefG